MVFRSILEVYVVSYYTLRAGLSLHLRDDFFNFILGLLAFEELKSKWKEQKAILVAFTDFVTTTFANR